ncbi:hypothetical protein C7N83_03095 [Neisseria iguanae]|uniref:Membrane protein insertase YidC n=1 Tax=Neisseria iguanae TaxID=90242 RepID=A0A2P7U1Z9_9NEIS|nr:hypothetical protein C7N83_03095 [Neisseria iguanae]
MLSGMVFRLITGSDVPFPVFSATTVINLTAPVVARNEAALTPAEPITVTTDTVKAIIDEKSGDLRRMTLLKYQATGDESKNFVLFNDSKAYTYPAVSKYRIRSGFTHCFRNPVCLCAARQNNFHQIRRNHQKLYLLEALNGRQQPDGFYGKQRCCIGVDIQ